MSKGKSDKVTYKPYEQHQAYLIPPSAEELIPSDHLVRLVNEVIDEMGIERLLRKYQAGGARLRGIPFICKAFARRGTFLLNAKGGHFYCTATL